jgi:hypothetical protein
MDFGSLMGMMGPPQPQMSRPARQDDDDVSDIVSVDAGDPDMREVAVKGKGKGRPKKKEVSL